MAATRTTLLYLHNRRGNASATPNLTYIHLGCELSLDGEPDFDKKVDSKECAVLLETT